MRTLSACLSSLNGVFSVHKNPGVSSAKVLEILKSKLKADIEKKYSTKYEGRIKMGHGGTLDLEAGGVLVVGIGSGTKSLKKFLGGDKRYSVTGCLGESTASYDASSYVTGQKPYDHVTRNLMDCTLEKFLGDSLQVPPLYSALKVKGKRLYSMARQGVHLEIEPRRVTVHGIQCTSFEPPLFTLDIHSGHGFYVRSLIHDLGKALDTFSHVVSLQRTEQKPFTMQNCLETKKWTLTEIVQAINQTNHLVQTSQFKQ